MHNKLQVWESDAEEGVYEELPLIARPRTWRAYMLLAGCTLAFFMFLLLGYCAYLVRDYLPIVGYVWLGCIALVPVAALAFAIAWGYKKIMGGQVIQIGPHGTVINRLGIQTVYAPMAAANMRVAVDRKGKVKVEPVFPSMAEMLGDLIKVGQPDMLVGFTVEKNVVTPVRSPWPGTAIIAGGSESGKTRRAIIMIFQAILGGADIVICDPHTWKPDGLAKVMAPFAPWLDFVYTYDGIVEVAAKHKEVCVYRLTPEGSQGDMTPRLVVYDEFPAIATEDTLSKEDKALIAESIRKSATQYRGVFGFSWIIGQEFTQDALIDTAIRRDAHAVFCHKLHIDYSSFLFPKDTPTQRKIASIARRECVFKDKDQRIHTIVTPTVDDPDIPLMVEYLTEHVPMKHKPAPARNVPAAPGTPGNLGPLYPQPQIAAPYPLSGNIYAAPTARIVETPPPDSLDSSYSPDNEAPGGNFSAPLENGECSENRPLEPVNMREYQENILADTPAQENVKRSRAIDPNEERLILQATVELFKLLGKEPTRNQIIDHLHDTVGSHWNRKARWWVIQAVCDAYNLSMTKGEKNVS